MTFSYFRKGVKVATLLLAGSLLSPASAIDCPSCGDANCDGVVDAIDALLIAQVASGVRAALPCIGPVDVSGDSTVNIADALQIGQLGVGLRDALTCSPVVAALTPASVSFNVEASCLNIAHQVTVHARLETASRLLFDRQVHVSLVPKVATDQRRSRR